MISGIGLIEGEAAVKPGDACALSMACSFGAVIFEWVDPERTVETLYVLRYTASRPQSIPNMSTVLSNNALRGSAKSVSTLK